jgi:regulator of protease activity HflC (stomatin/prohibitin superfamily)
MVVLFYTVRIGHVTGEHVGILLDRISGDVEVIDQSGVKIYNGLLSDFYVLDKTLQTLEMTEDIARGDRQGRDDLKVKTIDGSDVYVDLKIQYKIDPNMAIEVIQTSGQDDSYKVKWARDYVRSICRNYLGELTTEEFYDTSKRDAQIVVAQNELNARLKPYGIIVDRLVIPRRPHFYKEYEEMINKKKLADQTVLEEQSKAQAAKQKQQTLIVQETNRKNVAVEQFEGQMKQRVIAANADAEKARKAADAYHEKVTVDAGARLYAMEKQSEGILAKKQAEADGIKALRKALEGEGGRNMVKLEYARKIKDMTITGKPYTIDQSVERFEHLKGAASVGGK